MLSPEQIRTIRTRRACIRPHLFVLNEAISSRLHTSYAADRITQSILEGDNAANIPILTGFCFCGTVLICTARSRGKGRKPFEYPFYLIEGIRHAVQNNLHQRGGEGMKQPRVLVLQRTCDVDCDRIAIGAHLHFHIVAAISLVRDHFGAR